MATDATGTPTSLGIPKFNTANDAPSGLGTNAMMDTIDTLIQARIAKSLVTTTGDIIYASGASTPARLAIGSSGQVLTVSGGVPVWAAAGTPGYGTSLPGSPANGDEYILVDNATTPTYQWHLRYNSSSSNTDKWEFIGGSPQFHRIDTAEHSGASTSYLDLTTTGPTLTVPRAGIYEISFGAHLQHFGGATSDTLYCSPKLGSAATADADAIVGAPNINGPIPGMRTIITTTRLAASDVVKLQYKTTDNTASKEVYAFNRWLSIRPVRVS